MTVYLIKLILILVFNIGVNTYYINSGCNCSCRPKQTDTGSGGKQVDKFEIDLINNTLKRNANVLTGFKKIDNPVTNNVEMVINVHFMDVQNIYYTINEDIFNSIKEDNAVTITKNLDLGDKYIVFAVKTRVKDFKEENQKYDYYLVYCHNGNSTVSNCGLFENVKANVEIKILGNGYDLNNIGSMFSYNTNLGNIVFTKNFKTNNVTDMRFIFSNCSLLKELNLSNFNTNNVTTMSGMFNMCSSLKKLNLSNFNTNNVTSMFGMFNRCSSLKELNLSNFNTNNVTDMRYMFFGCTELKKKNIITKDNKTLQNFENT